MVAAVGQKPLHAIPVSERPPTRRLLGLLFIFAFDIGLLCVNGTQLLCLPLRVIPSKRSRKLYEYMILYTKASFGILCVLMCQWFAPTSFIVTCEGMDESVLVRDEKSGQVVGLKMPSKLVMMANHQVYCDWWYLWAFTYFLDVHSSVVITLKRSLKWVPFVGWGMQIFRFIFLARSWTADKIQLGKQLTQFGTLAQNNDQPLTLLIFPEGTLVSKDTRPSSKKFADKTGIPDMTNMLLPRSTGLLFSLRTLSPFMPTLHLLDVTIGYPGIPPAGYGQSYYTLRSVFIDGVPPPAVHLHLRLYNVRRDLPIGDVSEGDGIGRGAEASEEEKTAFDGWLRARWEEKDRLLDEFYSTGRFESTSKKPSASTASPGTNGHAQHLMEDISIRIPLKLRSSAHVLDAYTFFIPGLTVFAISRLRSWWKGM